MLLAQILTSVQNRKAESSIDLWLYLSPKTKISRLSHVGCLKMGSTPCSSSEFLVLFPKNKSRRKKKLISSSHVAYHYTTLYHLMILVDMCPSNGLQYIPSNFGAITPYFMTNQPGHSSMFICNIVTPIYIPVAPMCIYIYV